MRDDVVGNCYWEHSVKSVIFTCRNFMLPVVINQYVFFRTDTDERTRDNSVTYNIKCIFLIDTGQKDNCYTCHGDIGPLSKLIPV